MAKYTDSTWKLIKQEWLAGQLSISEVSRQYGPSRAGILRRARDKNWPARGSLIEEVRREIDTALVTDDDPEKVTGEVTPEEAAETIAKAARRGVDVIRSHRSLINRLLGVAKVTLDELDELERIRMELLSKGKLRARKVLVTAIIANRTNGMEAVSRVLAKVIPLERQAFSLDKEGSQAQAIRYVTPEMKKPKGTGLSEEFHEETE